MHISSRKLFPTVLLSTALLLVLVESSMAQGRTIRGTVKDEKGEPVADAQVTIQGTDIVRNLVTKTNKKGEYTYILGIQVATYRVIVRKAGYRPEYKSNLRPELGVELEVDFQLVKGPDSKLPFEMTSEDMEKLKKEIAQQEKRKEFSAEVKAFFDKGMQLSEQGMYAEAIEQFNGALKIDPRQFGIVERVAEAYLKLGKSDEAIANYQKAIEMNPTDANLYTNLGVALSRAGKTAESQEAFKKAAAMNPLSAAQNYYNLGVTLFKSGNTQEAADAFKQAIAADANYAEAYYQLGMCLSAKQETLAAAIEALERYVKIGQKPDQVEVAKQIISALKGKGK